MRTYRKVIGWSVRIVLAPLLVAYLIALFFGQILFSIAEASLRFVLEFGARVEAWETAEAAPEWRPLKESILEQRETEWPKMEDRPGSSETLDS